MESTETLQHTSMYVIKVNVTMFYLALICVITLRRHTFIVM